MFFITQGFSDVAPGVLVVIVMNLHVEINCYLHTGRLCVKRGEELSTNSPNLYPIRNR